MKIREEGRRRQQAMEGCCTSSDATSVLLTMPMLMVLKNMPGDNAPAVF
jgi:hypothetical protein